MFTIGPSPGGIGIGMIASRDIANGIPIVSEQPAMRLPRWVQNKGSEADGNALLLEALATLDGTEKQTFGELLGGTDLEKLLLPFVATKNGRLPFNSITPPDAA